MKPEPGKPPPGGTATDPQAGAPPGQGKETHAPTQVQLPVRDPERYQIIAEHARGGIGRVLRATDREFGRDVALKELLRLSPLAEVRFVREAIITARLEHPNIVPVHEAGRWPDGRPYYAMKLVSGRPLRELIEEARTLADRLKLLERVVAVADAIAYAHDHGVIHRDLKPSNIIVGEYGETIVIDWGLAKYVTDPDDGDRGVPGTPELQSFDLTHAGAVLGTPAYMAPEQAAGGTVSERSDVYALGAILLNVLGGKALPPSRSSSPAGSGKTTTVAAITATATASAAHEPAGFTQRELELRVPTDLLSIVRCAMAFLPQERYPGARAFGDDLRRFIAGAPVEVHRYTRREHAARWLAAHRRLVQGSIGVLLLLLAATVLFLAREASLRRTAISARTAADGARLAADQARRSAESERDRADRTTVSLLEQQGRAELGAGHPFRAAPFLAEAYRREPGNQRVRWLLTEALRTLDSLTISFDVTAPRTDASIADRTTYTVALSPDDSELLTGHDTSVAFWDPDTGGLRRRLPMPWLQMVARYTSDGSKLMLIVSSGGAAPARMLDTRTGEELLAVPLGEPTIFASWSDDARYVASIDNGGRIDLWSAGPPPTRRLSFASAPLPMFGCIALSPDGAILAARGPSELILAYPASGRIQHIPTPGEEVQQLRFSRDGTRLLTIMGDRSVRIWDVASARPLGKLRQHPGRPAVAVFNGTGSMIATTESSSIYLWDTQSTIRLASFDLQSRDQPVAAVFAHDADRLVVTTIDGHVRTWDFPPGRFALPLPGHEGRVRGHYLGDGSRVVTVAEQRSGGLLRVWNSRTGALEHSARVDFHAAAGVAFSPDGTRAALLGKDRRVRVVDVISGQVQLTLDTSADTVTYVAFSHDGRRIATATREARVRLWSADDGKPSSTVIEWKDQSFLSVEFSPDDAHILTALEGKSTRIWDSSTGKQLAKLAGAESAVATYSPDGQRVITSGDGGNDQARIWDASTAKVLVTLDSSTRGNLEQAFSPDGKLAATVDSDGEIRIMDAATGQVLRTIDGPTTALLAGLETTVVTLDFSPDGKRLLATGDGHAMVWNIELDPRSPAEVAALVAAKSPWRLVDGQLTLPQP